MGSLLGPSVIRVARPLCHVSWLALSIVALLPSRGLSVGRPSRPVYATPAQLLSTSGAYRGAPVRHTWRPSGACRGIPVHPPISDQVLLSRFSPSQLICTSSVAGCLKKNRGRKKTEEAPIIYHVTVPPHLPSSATSLKSLSSHLLLVSHCCSVISPLHLSSR